MNQIQQYRGHDSHVPMLAPVTITERGQPADRIDLRWLWSTLRRRMRLFLTILFVILGLDLLFAATQRPLFTAISQVALSTTQAPQAPSTDQAQETSIMTDAVADTETQVLGSRVMAERVMNALHLADPKSQQAAKPLGRLGKLEVALGLRSVTPPTPAEVRRNILDWLQANMLVTRMGTSLSFTISFSAPTPELATKIANEWAQQYTQFNMSGREAMSDTSRQFLAKQIDELRATANEYNGRVQNYRISHNMLSTSGSSLTEQEISAYNQEVASARAQVDEDQARLDTARAQLSRGSTGDDVGASLDSPVVGALRSRQADAASSVATLQAHHGPRYPDLVKAQSQLADVNASIKAEIGRVISNLDAKVQASRQRLASLDGSLSSARGRLAGNNASQVELDDLTNQAAAKQALYQAYLTRYNETSAAQGGDHPDARILTWAPMPTGPSSPNYLLLAALGVALGVGAGFAAALVAEAMFSGLTTGEEIEERLGIRYLGGIAAVDSLNKKAGNPAENVVDEPESAFAEMFRSLRSALRYVPGVSMKTVAITSALPQEGKTTITVCLARVAALGGERVIVVDCDSHRRTATRALSDESEDLGLFEVLSGAVPLDKALTIDTRSGAVVLGISKQRGNQDLLTGQAMDSLLEQLKSRFDLILLDLPPILPIADARLVAGKADGAVFVARWRKTADHVIRAALRMMPANHVAVAGMVLSRIDMRKQTRFGSGDATVYYHAYKGYYVK